MPGDLDAGREVMPERTYIKFDHNCDWRRRCATLEAEIHEAAASLMQRKTVKAKPSWWRRLLGLG